MTDVHREAGEPAKLIIFTNMETNEETKSPYEAQRWLEKKNIVMAKFKTIWGHEITYSLMRIEFKYLKAPSVIVKTHSACQKKYELINVQCDYHLLHLDIL